MLKRLLLVICICGIIAPALYANDGVVSERFTRYFDRLPVGSNTVFVDVEDISIVRLNLMNDAIAFNVRVYLSTFSYNPAGLPLIDDVYQYHNLLVTNLDASSVSEATMEFRLSKEWLIKNKRSSSDVGLYQLVDGTWVKQSTEFITEDLGYYYFKAPFSGFGYYVITAAQDETVVIQDPVVETTQEPVVQEEVVEEVTEEKDSVEEAVEEQPTESTVVVPEDESQFPILIVILIGILILGGGGYITYRVLYKKDDEDNSGFFREVEPQNYLRLSNRTVIKNIYDLKEAFASMTDDVFNHHVHDEVNDFAQWVSVSLHEEDCGMKLRLAPTKAAHQQIVSQFVIEKEAVHVTNLIVKKYSLEPTDAQRLVDYVTSSRQKGSSDRSIFDALVAQNNDRSLSYDLAFGMVDVIEDVIMHPEDEALIDRLIYDASQKKEDYISIKLDLLGAGWPRFVVEKKMAQHFRTAA